MNTGSILVIDIGGTNAKFAAIRDGRHVPETHRVATSELRQSGDPVDALARQIESIGGRLLGDVDIVVATIPGFLDPDRDLVRRAANIPEFNGRRIAAELADRIGIPVVLERDAIMSLRGEWQAGAGRGVRNLLGLFFGTGIGGAFLQDGIPFRGGGFALEIGNMPFKGEGRKLPGLRMDCLEAYVSGRVLHDIAMRHDVAIGEVFARAKNIRGLASDIDDFVRNQAIAIGIAYSLFSPDAIILGGGICEMVGFPFQRLTELVKENSTVNEIHADLEMRKAKLGWQSVLHGAEMEAAYALRRASEAEGG